MTTMRERTGAKDGKKAGRRYGMPQRNMEQTKKAIVGTMAFFVCVSPAEVL
jgi:hypothetical protein